MRILDSDESRQLYEIIAVFSTRGKTALNNHELFARQRRTGWEWWGDQAATYEESRPHIPMYNGHALRA